MRLLRWLRAAFAQYAPAAAFVLPWLGGALMLAAAAFAARTWIAARPLQRALAMVDRNVESFAPGGGIVYTPLLRFRTPEGTVVQVLISPGSDAPEFAPGDNLPVLYPPGQPRQAILGTILKLYRTAVSFGVLGVLVFDVGLILRLVLRPAKNPRASAPKTSPPGRAPGYTPDGR
jgi:hypothetical protein